MSPAARREAVRLLSLCLLLPAGRTLAAIVGVFVGLFAAAAVAAFKVTGRVLRRREFRRSRSRAELSLPHRHRCGRHRREHAEALLWTVSTVVRPFCDARDRAHVSAVTFAGLFLLFSILMGANQ